MPCGAAADEVIATFWRLASGALSAAVAGDASIAPSAEFLAAGDFPQPVANMAKAKKASVLKALSPRSPNEYKKVSRII
jgi:hypothetical protein